MAEPQKKNVFQRALDSVLGLATTVDLAPSPLKRQTLVGPKSRKEVFTLETRAKKPAASAPGRGPSSSDVLKARWDQFRKVFENNTPDLPHMRGIQRAIIPNTFGSQPFTGGFSDPVRDRGGLAIPGTQQTYASPATHTGATHFETIDKDDSEYELYKYNLEKGFIPNMTWAEFAQQRKSGKLTF